MLAMDAEDAWDKEKVNHNSQHQAGCKAVNLAHVNTENADNNDGNPEGDEEVVDKEYNKFDGLWYAQVGTHNDIVQCKLLVASAAPF